MSTGRKPYRDTGGDPLAQATAKQQDERRGRRRLSEADQKLRDRIRHDRDDDRRARRDDGWEGD